MLLSPPNRDLQSHRYAFVCGLHRSGTSLLTRLLSAHPMVSGFRNTGAIEDEGQFLQSVFPVENELGGVGRFGFDPRAHLTEASPLNSVVNAAKLRTEWHRHWDDGRPVLVEKTPSNLLRMRLLQAYFPSSYFIIVTRHPAAVALATRKWTEGNLFSLLYHWVHCYRLARADEGVVNRKIWVSYEALVTAPQLVLTRIFDFLELPPTNRSPDLADQNAGYFETWRTWYLGDGNRAVPQKPPARPRSLITRLRDRMAREASERSLPPFRRRDKLRDFYDALDAVALLDPTIREFGYSLVELERTPAL